MRIVLASSSRYRRGLLERLGLSFDVMAPNVDETQRPGEAPRDLVLRLAHAKADAAVTPGTRCIVIASDQVCEAGGRILGKPGTQEQAVATLASLSGRIVTFLTSLVVVNCSSGARHDYVDETYVHFRDIDLTEIRQYVDSELPLDCAGAIKSEGRGVLLFREVANKDPSALIGLPLIELGKMLRAEGVPLFRS